MEERAAITLKALLHFFHEGEEDKLLAFLPEADQQQVEGATYSGTKTLDGLLPSREALDRIHYSWLLPAIRRFPEELHSFFLGALEEKAVKRLKSMKQELGEPKELTPALRRFFGGLLYQAATSEESIPELFIPPTELSPLLKCSKRELVSVIDLLGVHDLADVYKTIIDKQLLTTIAKNLPAQGKEFLKLSLKQQRPAGRGEMLPLRGINGDPSKLMRLLHRRGLRRLGVALQGRPSGMQWHLTHILDAGRAQMLTKHFSEEAQEEEVAKMTAQVLEVLNFIKSKQPS